MEVCSTLKIHIQGWQCSSQGQHTHVCLSPRLGHLHTHTGDTRTGARLALETSCPSSRPILHAPVHRVHTRSDLSLLLDNHSRGPDRWQGWGPGQRPGQGSLGWHPLGHSTEYRVVAPPPCQPGRPTSGLCAVSRPGLQFSEGLLGAPWPGRN